MKRDTSVRPDRAINNAGLNVSSDISSPTWVGATKRIALGLALLVGFGSQQLLASSNAVPGGLTVRRSMRAAPHRLIVHPNGATVAANQTQSFVVTDAQGNPVAVHWNVSGIGCSGEGCGTIDEHGVYQPPSSLPKPQFVTIEGVLVSDPNYSVLTEVKLEPVTAAAVSKPAAEVTVSKSEPLAAPVVEKRSVARNTDLPPVPKAVASAPLVESRSPVHKLDLPPVPVAIDSPPVIENRKVARRGELPPPPVVVAAAPSMDAASASRSIELFPLPNAVASPPKVESQKLASSKPLPPLPNVVAATPSVERKDVSKRGSMPSLSIVIGAAPEVDTRSAGRKRETLPLPSAVAGAPSVEKANPSARGTMPLPNAVAAAPVVEKRNLVQSVELMPMPNVPVAPPKHEESGVMQNAKSSSPPQLMASASTQSAPILRTNTQPPSTGVATKFAPNRVPLQPMQDGIAGVPAKAGAQHPQMVTYSDGQLTINAENVTLAAVLQMVAEKTGAEIEIPPGTGQERIFEHAGPGRAEDVLAMLLNGSPFDFVIVGSPQGTHVPTQVLLSLHKADDAPALAGPARPVVPVMAYAPPAESPTANAAPVYVGDITPEPPKEGMSPEDLGNMMKEKTRQLRERIQQQQQQ